MNVRTLFGRLLGALAVTGFFAGGALTATASGPAFNNLSNDYATLQVAKAGETWSTSTTAQVGDVVNLFVWDHNTVPNTVATNTTIKVTLPTAFETTHVPSATVSADNATAVTGTASIATGAETKLTYIPGTAVLYRNVNGTMTPVSFPAGVNGDTVVTTGVNLGDQGGCWQYAQAVLIQVKVEGGSPAITTDKKVQLDGGPAYSNSAAAQPSDVVDFKIYFENTGTTTGHSAKITDTLDSHLTYVPNSSILKIKVNNVDQYVNLKDTDITFNGQTITWSFGDIAARPDAAFYLQFQTTVAAKDAFPVGDTVLQNCATSSFTEVSAKTNCVTITVTRSIDPVVSFTIKKEVTNITLGDSKWYDAQLASANPGDTVAYRLTVINTGNVASNAVTLKDVLPAGISYVGNAKLYNAATPNGVVIDGTTLVGNGYVFASIVNGSPNYQTIVFQAKVHDQCSGTESLDNWAYVYYGGVQQVKDDAGLVISCTRSLIITKDVWNPVTKTYGNTVDVHESDVVTFRINVQNNGNTTVTNPIARDVLPLYMTYLPNTLTIDAQYMSQTVQDAFFAQGIKLTDLAPGMGKVITFQVKISDCPPFGDTTVVNTGYAKADNITEISDTATVYIHVRKPLLP